MSEKYSFRQLTDQNMNDYASLFKTVFAYEPTHDEIKAKFGDLSENMGHIGYIAYSADQKPAAFYGVFPNFTQVNGVNTLCAQSGSTMTHPQYRNQGLFKKLAELTYDDCQKKAIQLVYGMPNKFSLRGLQSLGWKFLYDMTAVTVPLPTPAFVKYLTSKKTTDYFSAPKKIEKLYFYKFDPSENPKFQQILFSNIKITVKVTPMNKWRIGDIEIPQGTSLFVRLTALLALILEMTFQNASVMSFYAQPKDKGLNFFPKFLFRKSLLFGYFDTSGKFSGEKTPHIDFKYKDYDTY